MKRQRRNPDESKGKATRKGAASKERAPAAQDVAALIDAATLTHPTHPDSLAAHASVLTLEAAEPELLGKPVAIAAKGGSRDATPPLSSKPAEDRPEPRAEADRPAAEPELPIATPAASTSVQQTATTPREAAASLVDKAAKEKADGRRIGGATAPPLPLSPFTFADYEALARNMGRLVEYSGKAAAAYLAPRESGTVKPSPEEMTETLRSVGRVAESYLGNPGQLVQAQAALSTQIFGLWADTLSRFGSPAQPIEPQGKRLEDRRFSAPEWRETPLYDFVHQAYLATTAWAKGLIADAQNVDDTTREKANFFLRQMSSALSPANFLLTNPELLKETFKEKGENLVRGMKMLAEDIDAGNGDLKIRQSDTSKFRLGEQMAATPGKVVFRNDLMELLQYAPATSTVLRRPLLIVPPWINKYYVLDLNPEKSFIGWAVSQGLTVFVISWVNPDERHATKDWNDYMREGIFAALDAIEAASGERDVTAVGYCVGGTLLAATLSIMAAHADRRISSATFLTAQVDFAEAGDLKFFADEPQIRVLERAVENGGFLPGSKMANAFNMLRPDELIWSYAVKTYLKGQPPSAFDLLAWNADATRMSAANHAFYLRNCYLENKLTKGEMVIGGERIDLGRVTVPIYDLATKEDHIAPARSVFRGARYFGGPVRYVMAGSGHIAGVVNPPSRAKYQYWTGGRMDGSFEDFVATASETPGTWWLDWVEWIKAQAPDTVEPREPGAGALPALDDAPGTYVRVMA